MSDHTATAGPEVSLPQRHIPPPVLAGLAFGAQLVLSRRQSSSKRSRMAGWLLGIGSGLLIGGAVLQFQRSNTTVNPKTLDTTELVVNGPNRLTRNPMYLGTTGLLVAHALGRRSWSALLPAALYAVVIDRVQIPVEEVVLQERFGARFGEYRAVTPRWLGCPRRDGEMGTRSFRKPGRPRV